MGASAIRETDLRASSRFRLIDAETTGDGAAVEEPPAAAKGPGMPLAARPQAQARRHRVDCPTCEAFPGRGDVVLDIEGKKKYVGFVPVLIAPECEIPSPQLVKLRQAIKKVEG